MKFLYVLRNGLQPMKVMSIAILSYEQLGPLLLTWINFDPNMDK